jgi:trimeric autotransporter adhesin
MKQFKLLVCLVIIDSFSHLDAAFAQTTAFSYQGQLQNNGSPASGAYDFRFRLAADPLGNNYVGSPFVTNGISVANGLFVTAIDFGVGPFGGSNYWLEVDVRTNGASGYTALTPLPALTSVPYALFANTAGNLNGPVSAGQLSGTVSSANVSGTYSNPVAFNNPSNSFSGNGAGLANVSAAALGGLGASSFWQTGGNGGTAAGMQFLGTTDDQALEIHVNNLRALRLEPILNDGTHSNEVNVIAGSSFNFVGAGVSGATVGGGGSGNFTTNDVNSVTANFGTVAGGYGNTASGDATVGGGYQNTAGGYSATVGGGVYNTASGDVSFAAGYNAQALNNGSFVWADDSTGLAFSSTAANQFLIRAAGGVGIGTSTPQGLLHVRGNNAGSFGNSTAFIENTNTSANASPALRVIGWGANMPYGALSVSMNGSSGLIAQFGNLNRFVASIAADGTVQALAFNTTSDRAAKEDFADVNPSEVLAKVAALPITRWNFKQDKSVQHIGPMAQDFYAAFGTGSDDKHIATVDEEGVALAAIQGLNQKLRDDSKAKDVEIQNLKQQNDSLAERLNELETAVKRLVAQK